MIPDPLVYTPEHLRSEVYPYVSNQLAHLELPDVDRAFSLRGDFEVLQVVRGLVADAANEAAKISAVEVLKHLETALAVIDPYLREEEEDGDEW